MLPTKFCSLMLKMKKVVNFMVSLETPISCKTLKAFF